MTSVKKPKVSIIVANLGTPDEASVAGVRRFLAQFLSDQRVIEIPKPIWQIILRLFILPFRPKRVAEAYASVWREDSPMREILFEQVKQIQAQLPQQFPEFELNIVPAMSYGNPGIQQVLQNLTQDPHDHLILLPLFPQYSATSTAPLYDALAKWTLKQRNLPGISIVRDYYQHPLYIQALAQSVRDFRAEHGSADKLLMSFHGIPQPYADKGDPYADRCRSTAKLVAQQLGLTEDQWAVSFQSRFGKQEWVKPYTDALLEDWAKQGVKSVQIMSPAFSADCLETLEELAIENAENFKAAGGQSYAYIPALNTRSDHLQLLSHLLQANLEALRQTLAISP
ncbi:ferrochelatase [uncultured Acinetobacter sp.]|uniref:ferrochelatase n=1 Tax=uncultured Acinetobacter sp. TaxID=165433 RepID=UPI002615564A|nr:ferrochelatase [uncultured Acinetobacter sp.]